MTQLATQLIFDQTGGYDLPVERAGPALAFVKSPETYNQSEYAQRFINGDDLSSQAVRRPQRPYAQVVWVYRSIRLLTGSVRMLPLRLTKLAGDKEFVEVGPQWEFWKNPGLPIRELKEQTVGHKQLTGEAHWILEGRGKGVQVRMVVGRHQMVAKLSADSTELLHWELKRGTRREKILLEEVISDIDWSPYHLHRGISPLDAGALSVSQDYQASTHNESSLANNAEPHGVIQGDKDTDLSEPEMQNIYDRWKTVHQGPRHAGNVAILYGGLTWQSTVLTHRDMLFDKLKHMTAVEIVNGAFGIPPVMLGLTKDANYGFADVGQQIYWGTTMPPIIRDFDDMAQRLNDKRFVGKPIFVWLDETAAPIQAKLLEAKVVQGEKLVRMGASLNNVNTLLDLGLDETEENEDSWVAKNMVPKRFILDRGGLEPERPPEPPPGQEENDVKPNPDPDKEAADKALAQTTERIWKAWIESWLPLARRVRGKMRQYFLEVEKDMTGRLIGSLSIHKAPPSVIDFSFLFGDDRERDKKLKKLMEPLMERGVKFGQEQAAAEVGADAGVLFGGPDPVLRAIVKRKVVRIVEVNQTLKRKIQAKIVRAIEQSGQSGETVQGLTDRIKKALAGSFKESRARALTIARTEMAQTISAGRHRAFQKVGVLTKWWLTARDENVRSSHVSAGSTYSKGNAVALDATFQLASGSVRFPSDPDGPAAEVINCRCVEMKGLAEEGRDVDLDEILRKGFLSCQ